MRKFNFFILLFFTNPAIADNFSEANALYEDGKYEEAAAIYDSLIEEGYVSVELFYNAGTANFKTGELGKSVLYLSKAHKLDPTDKDILYNLDSMAIPAVLDNIPDSKSTGIRKAISNVIISKPRNFWSFGALVFTIVGFALLIAYLFSGKIRTKRFAFYSGLFVLFLAAINLTFSLIHKNSITAADRAVIMVSKVSVYNEPSENATNSFDLHEGSTVTVLDENEKWYRIEAGGNQGWVLKESLGII